MRERIRMIVGLIGLLVVPLVAPAAALAGQPVTQALNPPPPAFYTCMAVGDGTICQGDQVVIRAPEPTDVSCGSGPSAFQLSDQGTVYQHATRYYDHDGNLTRRVNHERWVDSAWSNPATGAIVPYTQSSVTTTILAVPGDFDSATETTRGENIYRTVDGGKPIMMSVGRIAIGPDDDLIAWSGKQWVVSLFFDGDPSVLDQVCAALS
jgi:hypothetical protein